MWEIKGLYEAAGSRADKQCSRGRWEDCGLQQSRKGSIREVDLELDFKVKHPQ